MNLDQQPYTHLANCPYLGAHPSRAYLCTCEERRNRASKELWDHDNLTPEQIDVYILSKPQA
jgi:hypothetical protein